MTNRIRKAVFPVAGLGTRFLPATKSVPKEMLPLVDKPLIQYAVEEAAAAGIEEFVFVTSKGKTAMEDHFSRDSALEADLEKKGKDELLDLLRSCSVSGRIFSTRQESALGLGHAVWCAREAIGDVPFAVILPDDVILSQKPCMAQMTEVYQETGGNMFAVVDVPKNQTPKYGIMAPGKSDGKLVAVEGLVEKPDPSRAPSTLAVIGRYILRPEIFGFLSAGKKGVGGEIQLTDAMSEMIGSTPFHGYRFDGERFDCGDKSGFVEATVAFALARVDMAPDLRERLAGRAAASGNRGR